MNATTKPVTLVKSGLQKSLGTLGASLKKAQEGAKYQLTECARILIKPQIRTKGLTTEALAEMAASIRAVGVMQPVLLRPLAGNPDYDYELISGERRLRGSMLADKLTIPSLVKYISDEDAKRLQRMENVQREGLCDADLLAAVKVDMAELKQAKLVAERWGMSDSWVSKILELDKLGPVASDLIAKGLTGDREVLTEVSRIEKRDPAKAAAIAKQIAEAAPTDNVRKIVKDGKGEKPAKAIKAKVADKTPAAAAHAVKSSGLIPDGTKRLLDGEGLRVTVTIRDGAPGEREFSALIKKHRTAFLAPDIVDTVAGNAWVRFADDVMAVFPCGDLRIIYVEKE